MKKYLHSGDIDIQCIRAITFKEDLMKTGIAVYALITMMCFSPAAVSTAEEASREEIGIEFDEYGYGMGYDAWGHPADESEESEWDGGIGRGEPDVSAIQAAGGDGTGRYD